MEDEENTSASLCRVTCFAQTVNTKIVNVDRIIIHVNDVMLTKTHILLAYIRKIHLDIWDRYSEFANYR